MAELRIEAVTKKFGDVVAVNGASLVFEDGQFTVLVGPSGCGKTTLLRMIAGLEEVTKGSIYLGEQRINDVPPWQRNTAMVFQNYALYPHKTVFENMAFPLRARKVKKEERRKLIEQVAILLEIAELLQRKPRELSGGQMQRVALGRAIVRKPEVFLMDEPLSNLDAKLRVEMRAELKRLQKDLGVTTIYVTHDQAEAMTMGDKLVVMRRGEIQQVGPPEEVYLYPGNVFVAGFIGSPAMNCVNCRHDPGQNLLNAGSFTWPVPPQYTTALVRHQAQNLIFGIRPEDVSVEFAHVPQAVPARVYISEPMGKETLLTLETNGTMLKAITPPTIRPAIGEPVWIRFDDQAVRLFDRESEEAIPLSYDP
jgi:multiple sugar transport system ATP-binding protein